MNAHNMEEEFYTLTYDPDVQGWVSFYSYYPEWIIGMNNYLYTFKGGNLYRHNTNPLRNTFYLGWWTALNDAPKAFTPTSLKSVFNFSPLENKLFKTINLEGDSIWDIQLTTDIQNSGFIEDSWFEKKEQSWYGFIRNSGEIPATMSEYALRSLNGIGACNGVSGGGTTISFSVSPMVSLGNISIGDYIYWSSLPSTVLTLGGQVTGININYPQGINEITVSIAAPATPVPSSGSYILFIKGAIAESHGVLGHYCVFNMQNYSQDKIELFSVETEIMKSFP
jgi:hypothetical protein